MGRVRKIKEARRKQALEKQQARVLTRRRFLKKSVRIGLGIAAGTATFRLLTRKEAKFKPPVFHLSIQESIHPETKARIEKMAGIALNFTGEKKGKQLSGKTVRIVVGTFKGQERLWDASQAQTFGNIRTPNYYAVTVIDFAQGKEPDFNVHLNWERVKQSFAGRPDAEQRAVLRSFGLLFNEVGGNVIIFDKYKPVIEKKGVTPELRRKMEIESFENGISLLESFIRERIPASSVQFRQLMLEEVNFQKGLLESWKR